MEVRRNNGDVVFWPVFEVAYPDANENPGDIQRLVTARTQT